MSADCSLHFVTECFGIRAPAPAIVPGQISSEIGQILEKPEAIDDALDHLVEDGPQVRDRRSAAIDGVCLEPGEPARGDFDEVDFRTLDVRKHNAGLKNARGSKTGYEKQGRIKPPEEPSDMAALSICIACAKHPSLHGLVKDHGATNVEFALAATSSFGTRKV